jgi:hypothetical protein
VSGLVEYPFPLREGRPVRREIGDKIFEVLTSQPNDFRLYGADEMVGKSATQIRCGKLAASDAETYDKWAQARCGLWTTTQRGSAVLRKRDRSKWNSRRAAASAGRDLPLNLPLSGGRQWLSL